MSKVKISRWLLAGVSAFVLSACNSAPMSAPTGFQFRNPHMAPPQFQRFNTTAPEAMGEPGFGDPGFVPEPDQDLSVRILRNLYKENFADDVHDGRPPEMIDVPRGGLIYEGLNRLSWVRKALYLLSDKVIKHEFNKPGVPDATPAISASALREMQSKLQPGDIVLCGNNDSFVHALIYLGNDQIIHALAQLTPNNDFLGVVKETLSGYIRRVERDKFVVLRSPNLSSQDLQAISQYAHKMVGTSYDSLFLLSTKDRVYCTEVVYQALQRMKRPPRLFPHRAKYGWDLFTVEDIMDSPDLETVYTYNYTRPQPGRIHRYH